MKPLNGLFIVLEGSDGSGKTTQFKLLAERLRAAGHEVDVYEFPRYDQSSSYFVQRYLNGEYGPASEVSPYTASLFYALDRFEAAPLIRQNLADGKIVLADRYIGSNMAHQGAKFTKPAEQRGFFMWADSLEFQLLGIPRPTINLFLRVPAEVSYKLIEKRNEGRHEHENDIVHLRETVSTYDSLCQLFPKDFKAIDCTKDGKLLPVTEINNRLWQELKPLLPKPSQPGRSAIVSLKDGKRPSAQKPGSIKDEKGTTVQSFEMKDVSLLALNRLFESGLSIDYQLNWPPEVKKARLNYYIPPEFDPKLSKKYKSTMDYLMEYSRQLVQSLPAAAQKHLSSLVPLAALVNARLSGPSEGFNRLLAKVSTMELAELRQITKQTRTPLKQPQALREIIQKMADSRIAGSVNVDQPVKLISLWPRNEIELLADCLYPYSNFARDEIAAQIDQWSYQQKAEALKTICRTDSSSILSKVQYRFDIIEDSAAAMSLIKRLRPFQTLLQAPTPRYGYRVPEAIEIAGADGLYIECFDKSLELFSDIQAAGLDHLAAYAVLLGHRQRWQFIINGQRILSRSPKDSQSLKLMRQQIAQAHPLISQSIRDIAVALPATQKSQKTPKRAAKRSAGRKRNAKSKK